jgi:hypothetical protein
MGTFQDGKKRQPLEGKEKNPRAGDFKTGDILPKLPATQHIKGGAPTPSGFKDLRSSTIRKGSI